MSSEMENALVCSAILDASTIDHVADEVSESDFLDLDLGRLWGAIQTLHDAGKPVRDMTLLLPELRRMGLPESVTNVGFLARLVTAGQACHAKYYAKEVRKASKLRQQGQLAEDLAKFVQRTDADPEQITRWLESALPSIGDRAAGCRSFAEVASEFIADLQGSRQRSSVVMSGIPDLDECVGGWMPGELVILAARTSVGKTALAMQIACHQVSRKRPVMFVSLEMKDRELVGRILCGAAEVNNHRIRSGQYDEHDVGLLQCQADRMRTSPLYIWAPPRATTARIRGMAKRQQAVHGIDLLIVDYVGLIQPADGRRQRYEQLGQVTGDLKALAKELSVPVLALCQLNREADGQEPRLSHLRESGSIEQDADVVVFVHRKSLNESDTELIVAKHRHGQTGKLKLHWSKDRLRFEGKQPWKELV